MYQRSATISSIEKNIGTKFMDCGLREHFINLALITREIRAKINEWNYMKLKTDKQTNNQTKHFLTAKEMAQKTHKQMGGDICKQHL